MMSRTLNQDLEGQVLEDRYELGKLLGEGCMGCVYMARDRRLGRSLAVKVLHGQSGRHERDRARLMVEAQVIAELSHNPNVVTIYDIGLTREHVLYIAMEFMPGKTLHQLLRERGPLSMGCICAVGRQVSAALAAAHGMDMVHRDLKPRNIMVQQTLGLGSLVRVLDFGLARSARHSLPNGMQTQSDEIIGTPAYMAPEVALGFAGPAADIFSLGVTLYEAATGRLPYDANTPHGHLLAHLEQDPKHLPEHWPDALDALLQNMMAPEPDDRPSALQVLERCRALEAP